MFIRGARLKIKSTNLRSDPRRDPSNLHKHWNRTFDGVDADGLPKLSKKAQNWSHSHQFVHRIS